MKRFLFLALMLFALVAFSGNAPPCDMGEKMITECNFDVGQSDNIIAGITSSTFEISAVGSITQAEISMEMIQIYPMQLASIEATMVDLRDKYRDVDCLIVVNNFSTFNYRFSSEMMPSDYTEIGYSIWE